MMGEVIGLDTTRGSMADHDRMIAALAAYEAVPGLAVHAYEDLRKAAERCGYRGKVSLLAWARARRRSYQAMMRGAVQELVSGIAVNNSLELAAAIDRLTGGDA